MDEKPCLRRSGLLGAPAELVVVAPFLPPPSWRAPRTLSVRLVEPSRPAVCVVAARWSVRWMLTEAAAARGGRCEVGTETR